MLKIKEKTINLYHKKIEERIEQFLIDIETKDIVVFHPMLKEDGFVLLLRHNRGDGFILYNPSAQDMQESFLVEFDRDLGSTNLTEEEYIQKLIPLFKRKVISLYNELRSKYLKDGKLVWPLFTEILKNLNLYDEELKLLEYKIELESDLERLLNNVLEKEGKLNYIDKELERRGLSND